MFSLRQMFNSAASKNHNAYPTTATVLVSRVYLSNQVQEVILEIVCAPPPRSEDEDEDEDEYEDEGFSAAQARTREHRH